jgi:hypothetical protein
LASVVLGTNRRLTLDFSPIFRMYLATVFSHAATPAALSSIDRDTGTAVGPAAVLVCPADLFHQLLAALLKRAGTVVLPAVKAAA